MIKKMIAMGILNLLMVFIFVAGMLTAVRWMSDQRLKHEITSPLPYPTGYEVLGELNKYRVSIGLPEFVLYEPLCNNIAERWQNYKENNSHKGFEEFGSHYHPNIVIAEILAPGITAVDTVENWKKSPAHDSYIRSNSKICVYSAEGLSVALLSN